MSNIGIQVKKIRKSILNTGSLAKELSILAKIRKVGQKEVSK